MPWECRGSPLKLAAVDYAILAVYFGFVLGIGWRLRSKISTSGDFLTSGRSVPVWITSLAFLSANLGAQELVGMSGQGAKYGIMTAHFYWVGAVPAMIFVGLFMMPFYWASRARSVPEYLKLRFDEKTRALNALAFAVMTVFSSGISMYALSAADSGSAEPRVGIGGGVVWVQTAGTGPHGAGAAAAGTAGTGGGPDSGNAARDAGGDRRAAERVADHTAAGGQTGRWGAAQGGRELGDGVSRGTVALLPRAIQRAGSAGRGFRRGRTAGIPAGTAGEGCRCLPRAGGIEECRNACGRAAAAGTGAGQVGAA